MAVPSSTEKHAELQSPSINPRPRQPPLHKPCQLTFSNRVCGLFSVFWLSFGLLFLPTLNLAAAYAPAGTPAASAAGAGAASVPYNAALAIYLIVWGFALFTFFIFTLKTNTVFALIFLFVTIASWVLSGAYWKVASGDYVMAGHLQKVSIPNIAVSMFLGLTD